MKKNLATVLIALSVAGCSYTYGPSHCDGTPVRACKPYVSFDFNSARIKSEDEPYLNWACDKAKMYKNRNLVVYGHADMRGNDAVNQKYSQRRATAVRDYLVNCGVDAERIQIRSLGKTQLLTTDAHEQYKNRRVIVRFTDNYGEQDWIETNK